jgi:hypothetical protein
LDAVVAAVATAGVATAGATAGASSKPNPRRSMSLAGSFAGTAGFAGLADAAVRRYLVSHKYQVVRPDLLVDALVAVLALAGLDDVRA